MPRSGKPVMLVVDPGIPEYSPGTLGSGDARVRDTEHASFGSFSGPFLIGLLSARDVTPDGRVLPYTRGRGGSLPAGALSRHAPRRLSMAVDMYVQRSD